MELALPDPCVFFLLHPAGSPETWHYLLQEHHRIPPLSDFFDVPLSVYFVGYFFYLLSLKVEFPSVEFPLKSNFSLASITTSRSAIFNLSHPIAQIN